MSRYFITTIAFCGTSCRHFDNSGKHHICEHEMRVIAKEDVFSWKDEQNKVRGFPSWCPLKERFANPACEICWGEAQLITHGHATETQTEAYYRLIRECKHNREGKQ